MTSFFLWRYITWTACDGDRVRSCKTAAEMGTSHWAGSRGDFPSSWKLHFFISNQVKRSFAKKEKEGEWGLNIKRVKVHLKEEGTRVSISRADCWSKEERNCWNWIPNLWISEFNSRQPWKYRILLIHHAQITDYFLDLANFYILSEEAHIGVLWFRLGLAGGWQEGLGGVLHTIVNGSGCLLRAANIRQAIVHLFPTHAWIHSRRQYAGREHFSEGLAG